MIKRKRYDQRVTSQQLGSQMGIAQVTLRAWERDLTRPNERQMD
jgi:transcriptional regulator with XRE-family HTH domain